MSESVKQLQLNSEVLGLPGRFPPIILLHGWDHSIERTRHLGELLSAETQVHLIDLPGHGRSELPPEDWGTADFAACIENYVRVREIQEAIFVGHSFGGKVSIKIAADAPGLVKGLVLIGASGLRSTPSLKRRVRSWCLRVLRLAIRFRNTKLGQRIYEQWYIPTFASPDYLAAGPRRKVFVRIVNEELTQELSAVRSPALLIWGTEDTESPPEVGERMQKLLKHSRLILVPNRGHVPFEGAGAHLVARYIRDFTHGELASEGVDAT